MVFHGSRHSGFSRSRQFRDPAGSSGFPHYFSGSHPHSEFEGVPPDFVVAPTFGEVWLSPTVWLSSKVWLSPEVWLSARSGCLPRSGCPPRSGCLPRSGFHPRSVHHPRSVFRPPPRVCPSPKVCLSPDLGLSVTRLQGLSVTRPQGLSVTQPRSVRHPTPRSVCHPTSCLDGFAHEPSQSPSSEHGPGRLSGRSCPPSGGWGLLSCSSIGGWPFSVPGGSAGLAPP